MGASFRNVNQIVRLAGSDLLTISPDLLDQLERTEGVLERKLDPAKAKACKDERLHLDEKTFRWMHNEDAMATEKLAEGIRKFNSDARHLQEYALSQVASNVRRFRRAKAMRVASRLNTGESSAVNTKLECGSPSRHGTKTPCRLCDPVSGGCRHLCVPNRRKIKWLTPSERARRTLIGGISSHPSSQYPPGRPDRHAPSQIDNPMAL